MNNEFRKKIKHLLILSNLVLLGFLFVLVIVNLLFIKQRVIKVATDLNQYIAIDLTATNQKQTIIPEYSRFVYNNLSNDSNTFNDDLAKDKSNATPENRKSKIAIIISNLGLNKISTELAINTPPEIALGFLPYTKSLRPLLAEAKQLGHELYLNIPMEQMQFSYNADDIMIKSDVSNEENQKRLRYILGSQNNYIGVYTNHNEIITDNFYALSDILKQLQSKQLKLLSGRTDIKDANGELCKSYEIMNSNVVIDQNLDSNLIHANLNRLVSIAKENGYAIGYSQGYTLTINIIYEWLNSLEDQSIELVPISELFNERKCHG
ncbi:MAG: divergent polysaccharide deacetylase family protein [Rickettsiaceae bacterium]